MTIDARDFGAAGDGRTMDTEALQRAIDACARTGGRVILQDGVFLTGTLRLRSHVELHIDAGATLLASPRCGDSPPIARARVNAAMLPRGRASCLLLAEDCENVALTGRGTLDCSGSNFVTRRRRRTTCATGASTRRPRRAWSSCAAAVRRSCRTSPWSTPRRAGRSLCMPATR